MKTDCQNCKHAHKWDDKRIKEYEDQFYFLLGRLPIRCDRYDCDKIAKGTEWTEEGKTYSYDGYSLDGENYDEVFECFEPKTEQEEEKA